MGQNLTSYFFALCSACLDTVFWKQESAPNAQVTSALFAGRQQHACNARLATALIPKDNAPNAQVDAQFAKIKPWIVWPWVQ